jgi:hypothetical protein
VKLTYEGLTLWYGTPDAPAPLDQIVSRDAASLVVGVSPPNPTNAVQALYRVDGGFVQSAPGREIRTDYAQQVQYFAVDFPPLPTGREVQFCPVLSCGGRQVPAPRADAIFPAKFLLPPPVERLIKAKPAASPSSGQRFSLHTEFFAAVTVRVDPPQFIGETPEGIRIDFYAREGTAIGPGFRGKIFPGSSDHMIVRPDGVGVIRVRAVIVADDGAKFEVEEVGNIEFGEDGYKRALVGNLPARSRLVVCPRILTADPKYSWINRAQCVGVGRTRLEDLVVEYDVFATSSRDVNQAT